MVVYFKGGFLIIDFKEEGVDVGLNGFVSVLFNARGDGFLYRMPGFFLFFNLSSSLFELRASVENCKKVN